MFAAGDCFFPGDLALPARKLQRHGRGSQRLALLVEMPLKITIEELLTCDLGSLRERAQQALKLPLLNLGLVHPFRLLDYLLDLRHQCRKLQARFDVEKFFLSFAQGLFTLVPPFRQVLEQLLVVCLRIFQILQHARGLRGLIPPIPRACASRWHPG